MNATPTEPSHLYIRDTGYVGVTGWSVSFDNHPSPACVVFTHENLSGLRRDDFHVNLLESIREVFFPRDRLEWRPVRNPDRLQ